MARINIGNVKYKPAVGMHHIQFSGEPTPATIWAGTTWEIDTDYQGRTIIGSGGDYTLGATGGSADAVVVAHEHEIKTGDAGALPNNYIGLSGGSIAGISPYVGITGYDSGKWGASVQISAITAGESGVGKNISPYTVVNFWKRTA